MADDRTLPERLLELALYVPVGLATVVLEELPSLAEKGRQKLEGQVQLARMVGKMAVGEVQRKVGKPSSKPSSPASSVPPRPAPAPSAPPRPAASRPSPTPTKAAPSRRPPTTSRSAPASQAAAPAPSSASLPIPGYDTLAASQVVQRLSSLGPEELDAVRRYEVATRGRRTILHRIAQLSTGESRASA